MEFTQWDDVPEHLATKTTLSKAGLKPAPDQTPAGRKVGGYGPYELFDVREAVPKRAMSPAQIAAAMRNLQKARAALRCVDCNVYGERLDGNGRCPRCRHRYHAAEESERALQMLRELAMAADWLILDTETTGLEGDAQIVQVGIVDANGQTLMSQLVRPSVAFEPEATAVNGIDAVTVAGAPTWAEVYADVTQIINGRMVLAYNAEFDERMVQQTCAAYGVGVPDVEWVCVMKLFAAWAGNWSDYHGDFRWFGLVDALGMRGVRAWEDDRYRPHDATGDAWLTWRLVKSFGENDETL